MKKTECADYKKAIAHAEHAVDSIVTESISLEDARETLKDLLGDYRTSAAILCNGFKGRDARLEKELRAGGAFPNNDVKLRAYCDGLEKAVQKHSTRLAERGFGKAEQAELAKAIQAFNDGLSRRGKERGTNRARIMQRDAALEMLRHMTSYFRRIGRAALKDDAARADFDRVARAPKAKKAAPPSPSQKAA